MSNILDSEDAIHFVFVKDPHFDLHGPPSRKDNYLEALFHKFDQIGELCKNLKVSSLLIGGDVFLKTKPTRIPHILISNMVHYFKHFPVPLAGIIGNHDAHTGLSNYKDYPINTLIKSGVYRYLDENPLLVERGGLKVKVGGVSYQKLAHQKILSYPKDGADYLILLAHMFIGPQSGMFFRERRFGFPEFEEASFDILAVGHEHVNTGVHEYEYIKRSSNESSLLSQFKYFIDSGQISRTRGDESNRKLEPTVVVITISKSKGLAFKEVKLDFKPASEIFHEELESDWIEEDEEVDGFEDEVSRLEAPTSYKDLELMIESSNYPDDEKELTLQYVMAER